ncbi:hypothetical protein XENTR_v10004237 [Xenopus tropicalis]|nr:hypothetical protein XENTR_v10004237 [Xenopus tropicalis]
MAERLLSFTGSFKIRLLSDTESARKLRHTFYQHRINDRSGYAAIPGASARKESPEPPSGSGRWPLSLQDTGV